MTFAAALCSAIISVSPMSADEVRKALRLYEDGMLVRSRSLFDADARKSASADPQGWSVLCDVQMRTPGYVGRMEAFLKANPHSMLVPQIRYAHAANLFDRQEYIAAADEFAKIERDRLYKDQIDEFIFCQAYCDLENSRLTAATEKFSELTARPHSDTLLLPSTSSVT